MKKVFTIISVAALLLLAFSCKKNGYEIPEKYKVAEELSVKGSAHVEFEAAGGSQSLSVLHNSEAVAVKADAEWVNVSASDQKVIISCDENFALTYRYAQVTISSSGKSCSIQVKQNGVTNEYFWEESYSFAGAGGEIALKYLPTTLSIKLKVEGSEWISTTATENALKILVAKNETDEARTGKVTWQAGEDIREIVITQAKGNGGGGTNPPAGGVIYSEDFEIEDNLAEWSLLDLDGDDYCWSYSSQLTAHSGIGLLFSQSYINNVGPLHPDNWAFSPAIQFTDNNYISFWVTAQDPEYKAEHYAVYIADAFPQSQSDLDSMTKLHEATFPGGNPAKEETMQSNGKEYVWQCFVVKVPDAFAGKQGYIVFRHFNCTDMYYLNLDDVKVTVGTPSLSSATTASVSTPKIFAPDFSRK